MPISSTSDATDAFERARQKLMGLAYRMVGTLADAEDITQDAWIRWQRADPSVVKNPEAFLVSVVSRLCLDRLRRRQRERDAYVGPWLPEPVLTHSSDTAEGAYGSDISFALMLALERLSPLERASFILHDVFELPFDDIAHALDRTEAACRQLAKRARENIRADRPRFHVSPDDHATIAEAFFQAARENDVTRLLSLLAEGVELHSDGGGRKLAALNVIIGAERVARFFTGLARKPAASAPHERYEARLNGLPAELTVEADGTRQATAVELDGGRVSAIYLMRNPDKLDRLWSRLGTGFPQPVNSSRSSPMRP